MTEKLPEDPPEPAYLGLASSLKRNIDTLESRRREAEKQAGVWQRIPTAIAGIAGSMGFVIVHVLVYGAWVLVNLGAVHGVQPFDAHFELLGTEASVEAIFLATFVLINQNRSAEVAEKRASLALHINLLTEDELTKLTDLVTAIAAKLEVDVGGDHAIHEVRQQVTPEDVLDAIAEREKQG